MKNVIKLFFILIVVLSLGLVGISTNGLGLFPSADDEGPTRNVSHFPKNPELYKPMPIPEHTDVKTTEPENRWITYDLATDSETVYESPPPDLDNLISDLVNGGETADTTIYTDSTGVQYQVGRQSGDESVWAQNFTNLSQITNPEVHPWRVNCKIYMSFASGNYVGSGVLIDPMHVLTAGHCVHDVIHGGTWPTSVVVVPAFENGTRHYGDASGVQFHSWTGWTGSGDWDHDIGVIDLDRPIGALTGWHGYGYNDNTGFYTGNTFHNPGYPAESPYNGQWMYYWYGNFDFTESFLGIWTGNEVGINKYSYGGQSGSGAYYMSGSNRWVYAVLSNGTSSTTNFPRITSTKFGHIRDDFIADDTPATFDLIPLDVNTAPSSVPVGGSLSSMNYVVHNYSSASWSGTVNVDVYISTNNNISISDTKIQSHNFTYSFAPKGSVLVNVSTPPSVPSNFYAGNYWIGVILDITDYSTANNDSDGQDASAISLYAIKPTVTTNLVTSIGQNSAVCGGNVTSSGGATVTARGVCWSLAANPTISHPHTTNGSGTGSYVSNIMGLSPGTTYHVRAYATNSAGTSYGVDRMFVTHVIITRPTVYTNLVTSIGTASAVCGGNVTSDGGAAVTARGVCWSIYANPTTFNSHTINGSGTGSYVSNISGLSPGTDYHVRAYATNSAGTSYGVDRQFITNRLPGDDIVGNWSSGVWFRDSETGLWVNLSSQADPIAAGDLDGDGLADLLGVWSGSGVWVRYSSTGGWAKLSVPPLPNAITCGDMNGDGRDDLIGSWPSGTFYRDTLGGSWVYVTSAADELAAGDIDGDGRDDLIGVWSNGVWVKLSTTTLWVLLDHHPPSDVACGDMNGDGRTDVIGTWSAYGTYYWDSLGSMWVYVSTYAELVAAGDIDGDGVDDLIGTWTPSAIQGLWVKHSGTMGWKKIVKDLPTDIDAGLYRGGTWDAGVAGDSNILEPVGGYMSEGPESLGYYDDFSNEGPGGGNFVFRQEANVDAPLSDAAEMSRVPGPGEPGFIYRTQRNLVPREEIEEKREEIK